MYIISVPHVHNTHIHTICTFICTYTCTYITVHTYLYAVHYNNKHMVSKNTRMLHPALVQIQMTNTIKQIINYVATQSKYYAHTYVLHMCMHICAQNLEKKYVND